MEETQPKKNELSREGWSPSQWVDKYANFVDSTFASCFKRIGYVIGSRPFASILLSLLVLLLTCVGFTNFYSESRGDKLWVPQNTQGQRDKKTYDSYFQGSRIEYALIEAKEKHAMLSKDLLSDVMMLYEQVHELGVVVDGETESLSSLCTKDYSNGDPCLITSVLENWSYNRSTLDAEANDTTVLITLNEGNDPDDLETTLGDIQTNGNEEVTAAQAAVIYFFIEDNKETVNGEYVDEKAFEWEEEYLNFLEDPSKYGFDFSNLNIYRFATRSFGDEFGEAIQGDISLLLIAYFVLLCYVAINLGHAGSSFVKMRIGLSFVVIVTVGLSIAASTGLCSGLGIMYTPLHSVLPFVILGIGVDDSFVISDAFDSIPQTVPIPERISRALSHAGVSITITSMTDFAAFAISSTTSIPALSSFCIYAAFGVLFLFIFQISFFSAFLALDARRQLANRPDILCCIQSSSDSTIRHESNSAEHKIVSPEQSNEDKPYSVVTSYEGKNVAGPDEKNHSNQGFIHYFIGEIYAPFLMKPAVKAITIALFTGLLAFSIIGASQLSVESAERSFIPDGSYLLDTLNAVDKYFGENGANIDIVFHEFDQFEKQYVMADIQSVLAKYDEKSPYLKDPFGPTFDSWYNSYIYWLNSTQPGTSFDENGRPNNRSEFYSTLNTFLNSPDGIQYNSSVVMNSMRTDILASKVKIQQQSLAKYSQGRLQRDADKAVEAMDDLRDICNDLDGSAFPWTPSYIDIESLKSIKKELAHNILSSIIAVFVIVLLLVGSPLASILICGCVVSTLVGLLGVMYYWDLVIDSVAVINLVLAIGLAVDYSAHVGHSFMTLSGTKNERAIKSLGHIGAAVLNGALSTFLAVMLLSVSESYVFRVLFKQFFATVVIGCGHGLILLPVLLSILGPEPFSRANSPQEYDTAEAFEVVKHKENEMATIVSADDNARNDEEKGTHI